MARIADEEIERLKREVSIVQLVQARGVQLSGHGDNQIGLCPMHDDHNPSLVISPSKNVWHCPALVVDANEHTLFVTAYGLPHSADALSYRVTKYIDAADVGKKGSCHLFRHTMATLMLERGADVRIIQEILGHSSLDATQVYTRVSIGHLKEVHAETHPTAKRESPAARADTETTVSHASRIESCEEEAMSDNLTSGTDE